MKLAPGPRGVFVHSPNNAPYLTDEIQAKIRQYVLPDKNCCGAQLNVPWAEIETKEGNYDWSFVQNYAQPWIDQGKLVSLTFYGSPTHERQLYGGKSPCPDYVLSKVDSVSCPHSGVATPVYWEAGYKDNYKNFIAAAIRSFENEPWVGYFRFGIGSVGEDFPALKIPDGDPDCLVIWNKFGLSDQVWLDYTIEMIDYIHSQSPKCAILLPINVYHKGDLSVAKAVAERAGRYGYGFGTQGFGGNWVNTKRYTPFEPLFRQYAGIVPLEIQTATNTGPESREGLLPSLIDTALEMNVQVFELYINEWFISNRPGPMAAQYKAAIEKAASSVGCSGSK